jgi:predicted RNA-binding protein
MNFHEWLQLIEAENFTKLSTKELEQLGQVAMGKRGPTNFRHPSADEWPVLRDILVQRSIKSNPSLRPELTAYTPGETLGIMEHPDIKAWHEEMKSYKVPDDYGTVIFVPCAKTKPWACATKGIYKSYNKIKNMVDAGELDPVYFVTISEPLGIVPQDKWGDFPQYDNPGLFSDPVQRSGMFTRDWSKYNIGDKPMSKMIVPFDSESYESAINKLAEVIAGFMQTNKDKKFIAFVKNPDSRGTHSHMLDVASAMTGIEVERNLKRAKARQEPLPYILDRLGRNET